MLTHFRSLKRLAGRIRGRHAEGVPPARRLRRICGGGHSAARPCGPQVGTSCAGYQSPGGPHPRPSRRRRATGTTASGHLPRPPFGGSALRAAARTFMRLAWGRCGRPARSGGVRRPGRPVSGVPGTGAATRWTGWPPPGGAASAP